jgi:hypothetical protein
MDRSKAIDSLGKASVQDPRPFESIPEEPLEINLVSVPIPGEFPDCDRIVRTLSYHTKLDIRRDEPAYITLRISTAIVGFPEPIACMVHERGFVKFSLCFESETDKYLAASLCVFDAK